MFAIWAYNHQLGWHFNYFRAKRRLYFGLYFTMKPQNNAAQQE